MVLGTALAETATARAITVDVFQFFSSALPHFSEHSKTILALIFLPLLLYLKGSRDFAVLKKTHNVESLLRVAPIFEPPAHRLHMSKSPKRTASQQPTSASSPGVLARSWVYSCIRAEDAQKSTALSAPYAAE